MFIRKNLLVAVAVSALLAACGGGDDAPATSVTAGTGTGTGTGTGGGAGAIAGTFPGAVNSQGVVLLGSNTDFSVPVAMFATPPAEFPNGVSFAKGTAAPIAQIGLRSTLSSNDGTTAGTTQNGRVAVSMVERASSVAAGEAAEALQVMVPVTYTATATGATAAPTTGGQAVISFTPKAGAVQTATIDATGLVKSVPVPDDPTSSYLTVDLDAAIARAGTALTGVQAMAGSFDTGLTFSNIPVLGAGGAALTGPAITVNGTEVTGGGVAGRVNVDPS